MRVMTLKQSHEISEKDQEIFKFTKAQTVFIETYLSNGMVAYEAAKEAVRLTSPHIYEKKMDDRRYFSMRASEYMKSTKIEGYLAKVINKNTVSSVSQVLAVVDSILHDTTAENKDRLKAAELFLKHYNAFSKHQEARSTKVLNVNNLSSLSDKELERELQSRLLKIAGGKELVDEYTDYEEQK